jgi:hypothetical protein
VHGHVRAVDAAALPALLEDDVVRSEPVHDTGLLAE